MDLNYLSKEQKLWRANINPYVPRPVEKVLWYEWAFLFVALVMAFILCLPGLWTFLSLIK
jgi:hypothetical protein